MKRLISILFATTTFMAACAPQMTQMEACPPTGCSDHAAVTANWPPYDREVEALAVRDLTCPAEQLSYSRVAGRELVEGCGKHAYYAARCDEGTIVADCHPLRTRDVD